MYEFFQKKPHDEQNNKAMIYILFIMISDDVSSLVVFGGRDFVY